MANEESPKQDGIPAVDIPDLKKKEKERKKAGASWGQGGKAGNAFEGAAGGNGAGGLGGAGGVARAAASAAARGAGQAGMEAGASFFGRIAQFLARLMTTALGKMAVAAAVAVMIGGVVAIARMAGGGADADVGADGVALGDISSSIRVKRDGDASGLNMAKNNGLVQFGAKPPAAAPPPDAGKAPDGGAPVDGAAAQEAAGANPGGLDNANAMAAQQDRLAHNMSMSKLSSSLGQGGSFGGKDIFSGGPKLGRGFNAAQLSGANKNVGKKGATASRAKVSAQAAQRRGAFRGSRALGRLMQMATLNRGMKATGTGAETASTMATDQFEGQQTTGGAAPSGPAGDASTTGNPGGGTSGSGGLTPPANPNVDGACTSMGMMADANGNCIDPNVGPGINVTPWAGLLESAFKMISIAKTLLLIASIIYAIGLGFIATCCGWIAAILMGIAAMICTIIVTVLAFVIKSMASQITDMGQKGLGDAIDSIGNDLVIGAWSNIIIGGAGLWFWNQVNDKMNDLENNMEDVIDTSALGGQGTGTTGTGTTGGTSGGTSGGGP